MIVRLLAALCVAVFAGPSLAAPPPLEAYGKLPAIEDVSISPDGASLAVIATDGENRIIVSRDIATGKFTRVLVGEAKVRDLRWADSKRLLITTSTTARVMDLLAPRGEWLMLFAYDLEKMKLHKLMRDAKDAMNVVVSYPTVRTIDGERFAFVEGVKFDEGRRGRIALYRLELERGSSRLIHAGYPHTRDWLVGKDGEPLAECEWDPASGRWVIKIKRPTGWVEVRGGTALQYPGTIMGLGRTSDTILISEIKDGDYATREMRLDGALGDEVLESGDTPLRDPADHRLIGYQRTVGDLTDYVFYEPRDAVAWKAVKAAYPGERVSLVSWSDDRRKLVVLVDSPTHGQDYALVDLGTKKANWIGPKHAGVGESGVSQVRPVSYKAADGLAMSGYLTLPKGKTAKDLPLVVLPHGGPAARDMAGFDWWSQALASRGYAVLQVNFRGSDGFGHDFMSAGFGQWGRKMQTDLSDGVRHLAGLGTIDPQRVCIVGASYGGYAALAGATLDRDVYRCAASVAGLSDLGRFIAWSRTQRGVSAQRYWNNFMGADGPSDPKLTEISPIDHLDKIKAPILLIHGRDDTVVPYTQSVIMADGLRKAGKAHEFVSLSGEDHWLSRGDTRLQMLTSVVAFLEKHNPPN